RIGAADELLELVLADAVDQETEDREVLPGGDRAAEGLDVALLIRPTQNEGGIDAQVAGHLGEFSEVVDFFSRGAGDDQLIDPGRRAGQHAVDVKMRSTDLAVRLDRHHALEQIDKLRVRFGDVLQLELVGKHGGLLPHNYSRRSD